MCCGATQVRFYSGPVPGKAKYHMSIGHTTVMAEVAFFGVPDSQGCSQAGGLFTLLLQQSLEYSDVGDVFATKLPHVKSLLSSAAMLMQ